MKRTQLLPLFVLAGLAIGTVSALDRQAIQIELEKIVRKCDLKKFKSALAAAEFKSADDERAALASCEQVARDTKKAKLEKITQLSKRTVHNYRALSKFAAQIGGAGLFGFIAGCFTWAYFYDEDQNPDSNCKGEPVMLAIAGAIALFVAPFIYCAKGNYTKAFHYDVIIKREIEALNEIIASIETAKNAA